MFRRGDFRGIPFADWDDFRKEKVKAAFQAVLTLFNGANPIEAFHLKKRTAYKIRNFEDDLVIRKLTANLKQAAPPSSKSRSFLVSSLLKFLEEGVPYRVYRLDIKNFYESLPTPQILGAVTGLTRLSPLSKKHIEYLLAQFNAMGGQGAPRGMAISAALSDLLMSPFDLETFSESSVYFYGRYVDDIIIITNGLEDVGQFISKLKLNLPTGLKLNSKKTCVMTIADRVAPVNPPNVPIYKCGFDYLGYQFSVFEPVRPNKSAKTIFRLVRTEIAPSKVKKIKLRIVRSFIDFAKTKNVALLVERIRYLTSNFSITDGKTGRRKLAGIYNSYPLLSGASESLEELDDFLRNAVLSNRGKVFSRSAPFLGSGCKRKLLSQSFRYGHEKKRYAYFTSAKIKQIQECWINE